MSTDHSVRFEDYQLPLGEVPRLQAGAVHLWLWDLDLLAGGLFPDADNLSIKVLQQSRRMAGRFLQRMILGRYLQLPGKSVVLRRQQRGKPYLDPEVHRQPLQFNSSHSGRWQLLALSADQTIGVDLEARKQLRHPEKLAARYFSPQEQQALLELPLAQRSQAMLAAWNRKEAVLKALGVGLAGHMHKVSVSMGEQEPAEVLEDQVSDHHWRLLDFKPAAGVIACLALTARLDSIQAFRVKPALM